MSCKNLQDGRCLLGLYGGEPSAGICRICDRYDGPPRGAGDVVHSVAQLTGVSAVVKRIVGDDCGCSKRRAALNAAMPFSDERRQE